MGHGSAMEHLKLTMTRLQGLQGPHACEQSGRLDPVAYTSSCMNPSFFSAAPFFPPPASCPRARCAGAVTSSVEIKLRLAVASCAQRCRFQVRKRVLHHAVQLTGTRSDAIALGSEQQEDDREKKWNAVNSSVPRRRHQRRG
jgi:hypothetical protein